jgi:hypothetical protein
MEAGQEYGESKNIRARQLGGWWTLHLFTSAFTAAIVVRELVQAVSEGLTWVLLAV